MKRLLSDYEKWSKEKQLQVLDRWKELGNEYRNKPGYHDSKYMSQVRKLLDTPTGSVYYQIRAWEFLARRAMPGLLGLVKKKDWCNKGIRLLKYVTNLTEHRSSRRDIKVVVNISRVDFPVEINPEVLNDHLTVVITHSLSGKVLYKGAPYRSEVLNPGTLP